MEMTRMAVERQTRQKKKKLLRHYDNNDGLDQMFDHTGGTYLKKVNRDKMNGGCACYYN